MTPDIFKYGIQTKIVTLTSGNETRRAEVIEMGDRWEGFNVLEDGSVDRRVGIIWFKGLWSLSGDKNGV